MSDGAKKDTPEQAEFRQYCRDWLQDNIPDRPTVRLPQGPLEIMTTDQLDYLCAWQKAAYDAGLVGCDYPKEYGGGGRKNCQKIANQEMQRAGTPYLPNVIGLGMACPTIFYHGQEHLKRDLLPKLLSGEEIWCQGFSEPGAGSDLANTQTFAEKCGDKWVINGHKVWTSLAHFGSWMILLARTSKHHKYDGLSYFVVPIKAALGNGVTVRPLIKITGETGFNEVIFENLEIDDSYRLDDVGKGWQVAMTTLLHERGAGELVTPKGGSGVRDDSGREKMVGAFGLIELAKEAFRNGASAADDPIMRDKIMQMIIRQEGSRQVARRARVSALTDHPMRLPLQSKLVMSEVMQDVARVALEMEGAASSLYLGDDNAPDDAHWQLAYLNSYGMTIAAGTSEVQRNILGERVLGMAKSK
jgi:alkylation response protein AidB-like acyl-CoA dehydrogenase